MANAEQQWVATMEVKVQQMEAALTQLQLQWTEERNRPRGVRTNLKLNKPDVYDGKADVSCVRKWLYRMEQMFAAEQVAAGRDVEEAVKLQYASTFLSGRALA
ncbi:hypothetical protein SARC_04495 [Sphaeroforma arctica JP610]|uniref:Retrotransposon gag domain-containing protein n=1 Tax=Sphaeroforma arctica JP610 TaxID=667725 RepID=A0A0L0G4S8_9EUKA|nr:hypothetical protein SARC_04495 [Sphaeroforma arctica JP610]KNC83258.1 hypothetical protein SARC_04495 [Sphaeroforma arctica JP610]|eukprot:XP_014157160.1 hypothetical protein SARC_04495 [Sphaeroforma arctica JP610]